MPNIEKLAEDLRRAVAEKQDLHPIFDSVSVKEKRPARISRNAEFKPEMMSGSPSPLSKEHLELELARFRPTNESAQQNTFFYLFQKYGWRIGSPDGGDLQDVAFCDAARVKYALENSDGSGYLLVKGDLSGIQEYIYGDLKPKVTGAGGDLSKRLRGRSVIVSLLSDFLANAILSELDLPTWHLLFAGGGHFNLLLPKAKEGDLTVLAQKIDSEMRRWFGDRLSLILAWIDADRTLENQAGKFFKDVNLKKDAAKLRQHHRYLEDHFFPPTNPKTVLIDDKAEENVGKEFPKQKILAEVVSKMGIDFEKKALQIVEFELHHFHHQLLVVLGKEKQEAWENAKGLASEQAKSAHFSMINDANFLPDAADWDFAEYKNTSFGFRFLGKNVPLKDDDIPKTFEELCYPDDPEGLMTEAQKKRSFLRLGSVRLDVDNLGYIFSHGLGENATLGQLICLSREMQYFFTARFDQLAKDKDIYVIYSGGDDAFAVGRWDNLIDFTKELQESFKEFVFKKLNFSAGIFLGDPRYPVGKFYRDAGFLLDEKAKKGKNQVDVFDQTLGWNEFASKIKLGADFFEILDNKNHPASKKLTLSFANRVLRLVKTSFHEKSEEDENGQKVRRGFMNVPQFTRNLAGMRYLFARHGYTHEELGKITNDIERQLTSDFIKSFDRDAIGKPKKADQIRHYLVAFNYALYSIRSQKKSDKKS